MKPKLSKEALDYLQSNNNSALVYLIGEKNKYESLRDLASIETRLYLFPVIEKQIAMHTNIKNFLDTSNNEE